MLLELLALAEAGRAGGHHEAGLPARPEVGIDGRHDDVHVGDAAVGDPRLGAVDHPLVLGLVVDGAGAERADVGAGVGLGNGERGDLELVVLAPEALRHPLHDLLGGAVGEDAGDAEDGAEDAEGDAGVAPAHLLHDDRDGEAGGVAEDVGDEVERVEADLGRLLDDRPGRLLPLVPFLAGGADDVLGEVVDPFLDLDLVLVEVEREVGHRARG